MTEEFEGVIILGVPRSGTTLLRRLLGAHPSFVCPPETNLLSSASRFLEQSEFAGGSVGVVPGLSYSGFDEAEILLRLREFLFQFWRDIRDKAAVKYWAEKTAVDVFHIDAIEKLCGGSCRYVCIVRHPLDVVCSLVDLSNRMQAYLPEIYRYIQRYPSPVEAYAHAWTDANRRLIKFRNENAELCISLRYEDLVKDPETQMGRVSDFLGEPVEDSGELVKNAMSDHSAAGLGDWRTYERKKISSESVGRHDQLGKWTINKLAKILNPVLPELGYDEIKLETGKLDLSSDRSQELARMVTSMKLSASGASESED